MPIFYFYFLSPSSTTPFSSISRRLMIEGDVIAKHENLRDLNLKAYTEIEDSCMYTLSLTTPLISPQRLRN